MTDLRPDSDPDTAPIPRLRAGERRRAAIALVVLAVAAVGFVAILVSVLGANNDSSGKAAAPTPSGPAVSVVSGPGTTASSQRQQTSSASSGPTNPPTGGATSCPTQAPCALDSDVGDLVGALNTYRTRHHRSAVTGSVTQTAKTCAVSSGDQCPVGFYWEPAGRSGAQVIHKIVSSGRDNGQLLDPKLTSVQVGWAYVPQSKSFEVALILPG